MHSMRYDLTCGIARRDLRPMVAASAVLVRIDIGVPQRTPSTGELRKQKRVLAMDVDVVAHEGRQPHDVLIEDRMALGAELVQGGVDVEGVPQRIWGRQPGYQCLPR